MPNTLTHSPADVVRHLLISLGIGTDPDDGSAWPVYATSEPDMPDAVITVYDTVGIDHGRSMNGGELFGMNGIQVRIRSATPTAGWLKADAIQTALAETVYDETVHVGASTYLVQCFSGIGDVLPLGKDVANSKRNLFTVNAAVNVEER